MGSIHLNKRTMETDNVFPSDAVGLGWEGQEFGPSATPYIAFLHSYILEWIIGELATNHANVWNAHIPISIFGKEIAGDETKDRLRKVRACNLIEFKQQEICLTKAFIEFAQKRILTQRQKAAESTDDLPVSKT